MTYNLNVPCTLQYAGITQSDNLCRVCLRSADNKNTSIFDCIDEVEVFKLIISIANVKIHSSDSLPNKICDQCLSNLSFALEFKKTCEASDKIMRSPEFHDQYKNSCHVKDEEDTDDNLSPDDNSENALQNITQFICNYCEKYFVLKSDIESHFINVHKLKIDNTQNNLIKPEHYVCQTCNRVFKTLIAYERHMNSTDTTCTDILNGFPVKIEGYGKERKFFCMICEYHGNSMMYLRQHMVRHTGERPWKCDLCPKAYTQKGVLSRHKIIAHSNNLEPLPCPICRKKIKNKKYLERHMLIHTGKQYTCDVCNCILKSKKSLLVHSMTHKSKSYTCEICAATFYTSSGLCNHKKKHFGTSGERQFSCTQCKYRATRKSVLMRHAAKHNGSKNFACSRCGMFFDSIQRLGVHEKRHLDNTNQCPLCQKHIIQKKNLEKHLRNKHKVMDNKFLVDLKKL